MITFIHNIFAKKSKPKKVLEKIEISIPFEEKPASTPKKSKRK